MSINKMDEFRKKFMPLSFDFLKKINELIIEIFQTEEGIDPEGYQATEIICSLIASSIIDMNSNEQLKAILYVSVINNLMHMQTKCIEKCSYNNNIHRKIEKSLH